MRGNERPNALGRYSGLVDRYHTWPYVRRQNVAEHCWQVYRVYKEIFGTPPALVAQYIMEHDDEEQETGDIQFGAKRRYPALKAAADEAGKDWRARHKRLLPDLPDGTLLRIKAADLTEMYEFARDETWSGNQFGVPIMRNIEAALAKLVTALPEEDRQAVNKFCFTRGRS